MLKWWNTVIAYNSIYTIILLFSLWTIFFLISVPHAVILSYFIVYVCVCVLLVLWMFIYGYQNTKLLLFHGLSPSSQGICPLLSIYSVVIIGGDSNCDGGGAIVMTMVVVLLVRYAIARSSSIWIQEWLKQTHKVHWIYLYSSCTYQHNLRVWAREKKNYEILLNSNRTFLSSSTPKCLVWHFPLCMSVNI